MKAGGVEFLFSDKVVFWVVAFACMADLPLAGAVAYGWGLAYHGQLGTGDSSEIYAWERIDKDVTKVVVGAGTYFLKADGSLWVSNFSEFGLNPDSDLARKFLFAGDVKDVACGGNFLLLLKADNTVWAAGDNSSGELGTGSRDFTTDLTMVMDNVASVHAGRDNSYFLRLDGSLWACGSNAHGQVGDGGSIDRLTPVQIATSVTKVAASGENCAYIDESNNLWAFGSNEFAQLGENPINVRSPVPLAESVQQASVGDGSLYYVLENGELWVRGLYFEKDQYGNPILQEEPLKIADDVVGVSGSLLFWKTDGTLSGMGQNGSGQLGDGTRLDHEDSPALLAQNVDLAFGLGDTNYYISTGGELWAAGATAGFGIRNTYMYMTPVRIGDGIEAVSCGRFHSLILKADGTLWATGEDTRGQLGQGIDHGWHYSWYIPDPVLLASDVIFAEAGYENSFYVTSDGTLWGTGANESGQLGIGTTGDAATPVPIATDVTAVSASRFVTHFIDKQGILHGMGDNRVDYALGNGQNSIELSPVQIATGVKAIPHGSSDRRHSLFIKSDNSLWGMGYNYFGQLGPGSPSRFNPYKLRENVMTASAGSQHTHFVTLDGKLFAMGNNDYGQLGDGSQAKPYGPVEITDKVVEVAGSMVASGWRKEDGSLYATGFWDGKYHLNPVLVALNVQSFSAGQNHVLMLQMENNPWWVLTRQENNWCDSPWSKWFNDAAFPWIWHIHHHWQWCHGQEENSIHLYDAGLGEWFWTSNAAYPWLFLPARNDWFYYYPGTTAPARWFYSVSRSTWFEEVNM